LVLFLKKTRDGSSFDGSRRRAPLSIINIGIEHLDEKLINVANHQLASPTGKKDFTKPDTWIPITATQAIIRIKSK
jgi:hypothetical protein